MNNSLNQQFSSLQQTDPRLIGYNQTYNKYEAENTNRVFPEHTDIKNYQTSQRIMNKHEKIESTPIDKTFYSEIRSRYGIEKPIVQQIPINIQTPSQNQNVKENIISSISRTESSNQSIREISPVKHVENVNGSLGNSSHDLHGEERTVTIKRKITKRKKANEPVNALRDSYIDKISLTTRANEQSSSDTDIEPQNSSTLYQNNREPNSTRSIPKLEQPSPLKEIKEELIVPQPKKKQYSEFPIENLDQLIRRSNQANQTNEYQKNPDWTYKDSSLNRGQTPQFQRHISDTTTYNTYIKEKETGPISNYSARKENMKTQQLMDGRSGSMRTLPLDRRVNEMTEEIETITLQPIGKGVQDLAPGMATISRPGSRAATPRAYDATGTTAKTNYYREENKQTGGYNTMPSMPKFNKFSSARNVNQMSNYDIPDAYRRGVSTGRAGHEQVVNTSWHTRTESYTGGNRNFPQALSPVSNHESIMSANMVSTGMEDGRYPLQTVLNTEDLWYQPGLNREEVIRTLRDKETGSFIIRNSSTFVGAYGLALKVSTLPENAVRTNDPQNDLIRHFLIETVDEASGSGVRLKGFTNEPIYPSLAHLVQDHCQNPRALPTKLMISSFSSSRMDHEDGGMAHSQYQYGSHQRQQVESSRAQMLSSTQRSMSSPGVNFIDRSHPNPLHRHLVTNALYLGKVDVDRLIGKAAVKQAVTKIMSKKYVKTTTTEVKLDSTNGIILTDKMQTLFYTRQFPAQHVLSADFDPESREFSSPVLQNRGLNRGRIIGIVVRKQKMILRENIVHLFCEIDKANDLNDIITFINENYLRRA